MKYQTAYLQNVAELQTFIALLKQESVRSYLEIGCKFGGSLWMIANALPTGSRVVGVDLPHGDTSFKESEPHLIACGKELKRKGYDARIIIGDSTDRAVIEQVRALGPYDAIFIDANHTLPYVNKDWANYGGLGKLVAFHDINFYRPGGMKPGKKPIEVPQVWQALKQHYRHMEIIKGVTDANASRDNGIGVLWPN